jgi:hypothetical protein
MKPVDQTHFGVPHGNCLMSCVASILEVPLESLPVLQIECDVNRLEWWDVLLDALRPHGFTALHYPNGTDGYPAIAPRGYHIASGPTPKREFRHATVYLDGKLAHDPHPSRDGLARVERYYLIEPLADASSQSAVQEPLRSHTPE